MIRKSFTQIGRVSQKYSPLAALKSTPKTMFRFGNSNWVNAFTTGSLISMSGISRGFAEAVKKSKSVVELASIE